MQILTITMDLPLHPGNLPGLRACIAELVGFEHQHFHNHSPNGVETDRNWSYPLVQYAVRKGKAAIIGIGPGAAALRDQFLPKLEGVLTFAGQTHHFYSSQVDLLSYQPEILPEEQKFSLSGWLALKAESYRAWKQAGSEEERLSILGRALTGQLRSVAETLEMPDHKAIVGRVIKVNHQKKITWHGANLIRFDVEACANLNLPAGINIGRGAAFGFGEVCATAQPPARRKRIVLSEVAIP